MVKLYLAETSPSNIARAVNHLYERDIRANILMSYWYFKGYDLEKHIRERLNGHHPRIFADSGAYSAFSLQGELDVKEYALWLERWKHLFEAYANLDDKRDVKQTIRNQAFLEDQGLSPLPVFHYHHDEPISLFENLCDKYDYVAIGGMAGSGARPPEFMRWLIKVFKIAEQAKTRLHAFGMTRVNELKLFPWHSVDSSSWGYGGRYGKVQIWDIRTRKIFSHYPSRGANNKAVRVIEDLGYNPDDFTKNNTTQESICNICAYSYYCLQEHITTWWAK